MNNLTEYISAEILTAYVALTLFFSGSVFGQDAKNELLKSVGKGQCCDNVSEIVSRRDIRHLLYVFSACLPHCQEWKSFDLYDAFKPHEQTAIQSSFDAGFKRLLKLWKKVGGQHMEDFFEYYLPYIIVGHAYPLFDIHTLQVTLPMRELYDAAVRESIARVLPTLRESVNDFDPMLYVQGRVKSFQLSLLLLADKVDNPCLETMESVAQLCSATDIQRREKLPLTLKKMNADCKDCCDRKMRHLRHLKIKK